MANRKFITNLFDSIAPAYDNLNHILSLNIDKIWRRRAVQTIRKGRHKYILDVACGTGDFSLALASTGGFVTGIDLSEGMLQIGRKKVAKSKFSSKITMIQGDCEHLPFEDGSFDVVGVAFGVRNFENLRDCICEIRRVLDPRGRLVILELSTPDNKFVATIYKIYFRHILPTIGGIISGDKAAYQYLNKSVELFPKEQEILSLLRDCGFAAAKHKSFTQGLCRMYVANKG